MIALQQIKAARAMLGLNQRQLAKKAKISTATLNNIERGVQTDPKLSTVRAIQKALETQGIEFSEDADGTLGVRLKAARQREGECTVLMIDDSEADRALYKAWLNKPSGKKYKIVEASTAKDGYEAFLAAAPACIILDFMIYGKDGFQLLVEMRREHAQIPPIIFITGMHSDLVRREALALGVHTYLDKNKLTKERLCDVVAEAVR